MPLASRAVVAAVFALFASSASARVTDPEMSCATYLKSVSAAEHRPKGRHVVGAGATATIEAKIRAFCAANPRMTAMDAEMTITGD